MRRFRCLAFDLDGVLVDTSPCHAQAYAELWRDLGVEGPTYACLAGRRTRDVLAEVAAALAVSAEQLDAWTHRKQERAREIVARAPIDFADSAPTLRALHAAGLRLALGTSASRTTADLVLRRFGWEAMLVPVIAAEDVQRGKPDPEVWETLLARAGVDPADALVVEDSGAGIAAGLGSGAYVACVRSGLGADHPRFVGSFADLATLAARLGVGQGSPCRG